MSSAPHKVLQHKLSTMRQMLDERHSKKRTQRLEEFKKSQTDEFVAPHTKATNSEALTFFKFIQGNIQRDMQRLLQPTPTEAPATPPLNEPIPAATLPTTPMLAHLVEAYLATEPLIPTPDATEKTQAASPHVLALMRQELELLIETNTQLGNIPGPLLAKLKQAIAAYAEGRTSDTITVLKTALTGDPHNQTLLTCISQILYAQAARGTATALPEAREFAQRSIIANQKQRPARLALYQYLAIVTERAFSEERALEWIRNTELLSPAPMQTSKGLMVHYGIPLRVWGILAGITPTLWSEHEYRALNTLVTHVVGGAALYVCWLRESLTNAAAMSKTPLLELEGIEKTVQATFQTYETIIDGLVQINTTPTAMPWIVRWRWLQTLVQVSGTPALETILLHIALDGQNWAQNIYPDHELQTLLDEHDIFAWRVWAQSVTPFKDMRKAYLIPSDELAIDAEAFKEIDGMLNLLKNAEAERVRDSIWNDLKPWLVRWHLDHFLATATGSNQPRTRYAPTLYPFNHFYRRWQDPQVIGLLASEVIGEVARRGGFANWYEVLAAFQGALRLLDDPHHGLLAVQRRAFYAAQKKNPSKFTGKEIDFGRAKGSGMGMALLPLGFMGALFAIFNMASNTSQAIGLSLALFGLAGVVLLNLSSKK
jgi:hypothetical protein